MEHTLSFIKRVIYSFWSKKTKVDYLQLHYDMLAGDVIDRLRLFDQQKLGELMEQRDKLKRRKKKWSHVQQEIEKLKTKIILDEMRSK